MEDHPCVINPGEVIPPGLIVYAFSSGDALTTATAGVYPFNLTYPVTIYKVRIRAAAQCTLASTIWWNWIVHHRPEGEPAATPGTTGPWSHSKDQIIANEWELLSGTSYGGGVTNVDKTFMFPKGKAHKVGDTLGFIHRAQSGTSGQVYWTLELYIEK